MTATVLPGLGAEPAAARPPGPVLVAGGVAAVVAAGALVGLGSVEAAVLVVLGAVAVGGVALTLTSSVDTLAVTGISLLYGNVLVAVARHTGAPSGVAGAVPVLLLALAVAHHVLLRRRPFLLPTATIALVAVLGAHALSTLLAGPPADRVDAAQRTASFAFEGLALFLLVVNAVRTPGALRAVAWGIVLISGALGALSVLHQLTGRYDTDFFGLSLVEEVIWQDGRNTGRPRLGGPIGEKNFFCLVLLASVPLAWYLARTSRGIARSVPVAAAALSAGGALTTYSRGGLLAFGLVVGALATVGFLPRRLGVALLVGGLVVLASSAELRARLGDLVDVGSVSQETGNDSETADLAVVGRYASLVAAVDTFADHPVVGVGPGQERMYYLPVARELGIFVHDEPRDPHNLLLQTAAGTGLVGLVPFLAAVGGVVWSVLAARRRAWDRPEVRDLGTALLTTVLVLFVGGIFLPLRYIRYLYLCLALAAAFAVAVRREGMEVGGSAPPAR